MNKTEKELLIEWLETINTATSRLIKNLSTIQTTSQTEKYKVADFSKIIGCSQKTVYALIRRNEVKTTSEKVRGRRTTFIVASNNDIEQTKKTYKEYSNNCML